MNSFVMPDWLKREALNLFRPKADVARAYREGMLARDSNHGVNLDHLSPEAQHATRRLLDAAFGEPREQWDFGWDWASNPDVGVTVKGMAMKYIDRAARALADKIDEEATTGIYMRYVRDFKVEDGYSVEGLPPEAHEAHRRMMTAAFGPARHQFVNRFDVLYWFATLKPTQAVKVSG